MELTVILALVVAFGIAMYVVLDGFDLGVGILHLWARTDGDGEVMMNSIAPIWDGNETWLVLGGAMLIAAFPLAYSVLLPLWYVPLAIMLMALVFRGVAFEFRPQAHWRKPWDWSFSIGSLLAAAAQGAMLGSFVLGVDTDEKSLGQWLTPFSVMTSAGVVVGYALLGATWLIYKTDGALQDWSYRVARRLLWAVLAFIGAVSLWTPWAQPEIAARWFAWPNLLMLSPVPLLTGWIAWRLWSALARRRELAPFVYTVALFLLGFLGLAISSWPYAVPRRLTVWEAAASSGSQTFMLVGVLIMLPLVLGYTVHTYRVFRRKAGSDLHYH